MKTKLFIIQDLKAQRTLEPFSCPTVECAKRNFIFGCLASDTPPADCLLWKVGEFESDEVTLEEFGITNTKISLVTVTEEEVVAYQKLFASMHPAFFEDEEVTA